MLEYGFSQTSIFPYKELIREYTGKPVFWNILHNNLVGEHMDQKTRIVAF